MSFIWSLFLPHNNNNYKAHLIKSSSLFFLSLSFVFLQIFLTFFLLAKPAVLGFSSNISPESIIELTNSERAKSGLAPLKENKVLSEAARQKAGDMFAFNYWSHVSPSGRSPWAFFTDVGYKYQYAGENLARDFRDPGSVITAWMNSPSHKENIVNGKYQEIGVAVVDGTLQGTETTLVVQLFGTPYGAPVASGTRKTEAVKVKGEEKPAGAPQEVLAKDQEPKNLTISSSTPSKNPVSSPLDLTKAMAIFTVGVLIGVFAMDFFFIAKNQNSRLSSKSLAQMAFLIFVLIVSLAIKEGAIL